MTINEFIDALPAERRATVKKIREQIASNLPEGFAEIVTPGFINYNVPHSLYPKGYHCDPKQPLPFISIASQKNYIAVYHMGLYSDPEMLDWFTSEYPKHVKGKLDMGKSCIRFRKTEYIPYELMGKLAAKMSPQQWIKQYESVLKK
jgi:uncharacterized protein YdhG (YjbR/CyaY superfamily)